MIDIDLEVGMDELIQRLPSEKLANIVMVRALNRGITAGRSQAVREVSQRYTVKMKKTRTSATVTRANRNKTAAEVLFRGGALNLAHFKLNPSRPQPARRPVLRATIRKEQGPVKIKGAFLAPLRKGLLVASRKGTPRLPIEERFGPSVPSMMRSEGIRESVMEYMADTIMRRLDHEVNREMEKLTQ